jgi:uncharacterized membrane protein YtjA (UPF0391 family)
MARLYAQFGAVAFLVFGVGGLLTGDAGTLVHHLPQGNLGNVTLHLTYTRDILNLVIAGALGFAGVRASDSVSGEIALTVGVVLLLLALIGFTNPDTRETARSIASLHFTQPINIFDAIAGALGVLCGLGTAVAAEPVST